MSSISVALIQSVQTKSVAEPVSVPTKEVAVRAPVVALYSSAPSVLGASEPVAESYIPTNEVESVESTTVTVEARVAKSTVILFGTSASVSEAQVRLPLAAMVVAKVFAPQSVGLAARAVAVSALPVTLPVSPPMKVVAVTFPAERTLPDASTSKFVKSIKPVVPTISFAPTFIAFTISTSETSIASVITAPPPVVWITKPSSIAPALVLSIVNL